MNKKLRNILIIIAALLLLVLFGVVIFLSDRISMNPAGTVGNTAGNINNEGYFCEYNGTVYFSNRSDGGSLCAMNPDESDIRRLSTLKVRNILAGGDYLYYFQTGTALSVSGFANIPGIKSFNRCKLNGSNETALTRDVVITGQLVDNYLYLLTSGTGAISFYKLKIDNTDQTILADYNVNPACAVNGTIYYNGTQRDHYLYGLNTANDSVSEVWRGNLWYPIVEGDYVYYMDVANNYRLCRYSMSQNLVQILTEDRVDCFNVGSGYIYYQKNGDEPQLKFMSNDGSNVQVLASGNYSNINMTSRYVYFQPFGSDNTMYHAPLGSLSYSTFAPVLN